MKDPNLSELVRTCIRCWLYLVPQAFLGIHLFDMFMRRKNSIKPLMIWQLLRVFLIGGISDIILRGYYGDENWWGILMMFCSVVIMIANTVLIYYTFEGSLPKVVLGAMLADIVTSMIHYPAICIVDLLSGRPLYILKCPVEQIEVYSADTDVSPYDSGSYASSTAYVTGKAVEKCAWKMREQICRMGAELMNCDPSEVIFDGREVIRKDGGEDAITLEKIATHSMCNNNIELVASATHSSSVSPPPFMVGAAEVETDLLTGEARVLRYCAAVDCGTPLNENLVRVQAEGGILQGIGMALTEDINYNERGMPRENSLMQYKIPSRLDIGSIEVAVVGSYEPTGPFGAKSIGEVVINTPGPAIADALARACGVRFYELPITAEQIAMRGRKTDGTKTDHFL